jgi:hypothetical protein
MTRGNLLENVLMFLVKPKWIDTTQAQPNVIKLR